MNFISTSDEDTRKALLLLGFQEISNTDGLYTFINSSNVNFAELGIDEKKIVFNNMLCI